jgi:site-specific DNA recombinase
MKHDFALVGQIKKGRYIYYRCTDNKSKCDVPYVREEALDEAFAKALAASRLEDDLFEWLKEALRRGHEDKAAFHRESVERLIAESKRLDARIETMYVDRVDGRVEPAMYEKLSAAWKARKDEITRELASLETANYAYLDFGVKLMELAQRADSMFLNATPPERRRLLNWAVWNCSWRDEVLTVEYRQPLT